jgi:hypothetical protein
MCTCVYIYVCSYQVPLTPEQQADTEKVNTIKHFVFDFF